MKKTPLSKYLEQSGEKQVQFAKRARVSSSALNSWLHGKRIPDIASAVKVEKATGGAVTVYSWAK